MNRIKNALIAFGGLSLLIGAIAFATPRATQGQNDTVGPTKPVKVVNTASEPVPVQPSIPAGAFSHTGFGDMVSGPDPEGTSYAITSFTVTTFGTTPAPASFAGAWGTTNGCTSFPPSTIFKSGVAVHVPAGETVHIAFPQPFVLSSEPGASSCLIVTHPGGAVRLSVVGYRF